MESNTGDGGQGLMNNKAVLIGAGVAGIAALAGLVYYIGTRPVKRDNKRSAPLQRPSPVGGSQPASKTPVGSGAGIGDIPAPVSVPRSTSGFTHAKDAPISLAAASKMASSPETLLHALEQASKAGDHPSCVNILYILATVLSQAAQVQESPEEALKLQTEAIKFYEQAYAIAKELRSDMEGPIVVEMGVLHFTRASYRRAIDYIETGVELYLRDPDAVANINESILLSFFYMLYECYSQQKLQPRGVAFFKRYIEKLNSAGIGEQMKPTLYAHLGEFMFDQGNFDESISYLRKASEGRETMSVPVRIMFFYHFGVALVATKNSEEGLTELINYVNAAKEHETAPSGLLDAFILIIRVCLELDKIAQAQSIADEALVAIKALDKQSELDQLLTYAPRLAQLLAMRLQKQDAAEEVMEYAVNIARESEELGWNLISAYSMQLGETYHAGNHRDKAIDLYEMLLKEVDEKRNSGASIISETGSPLPIPDDELIKIMLPLMRLYAETSRKIKAVEILQRMQGLKTSGERTQWFEVIKHYRLGKLLTIMGDLVKGQKSLDLAYEICDHGEDEVRKDLELKTLVRSALLLNKVQQGGLASIKQELSEVLALFSGVTKSMLPVVELETDLGELYILLGDYQTAKSHLEQAVSQPANESKTPSVFAANVRLVVVYNILGEREKAEEALAKAQENAQKDGGSTQLGSAQFVNAFHLLYAGNIDPSLKELREVAPLLDPGCMGMTPLSFFSHKLLLAEALYWSVRDKEDKEAHRLCEECLSYFDPAAESFVKDNLLLQFTVIVKAASILVCLGTQSATERAESVLTTALPKLRENASAALVAEALILLVICRARLQDEKEHELLSQAIEFTKDSDVQDRRSQAVVKRWAAVFYGHYLRDEESSERHFSEAKAIAEAHKDTLTLWQIGQELREESRYHESKPPKPIVVATEKDKEDGIVDPAEKPDVIDTEEPEPELEIPAGNTPQPIITEDGTVIDVGSTAAIFAVPGGEVHHVPEETGDEDALEDAEAANEEPMPEKDFSQASEEAAAAEPTTDATETD